MRIVLHVCCGVCAAGVAETLTLEGHEVLGFFYNPNIHPRDEYERRLEAAYRVAREFNLTLVAGPYTPEEWFKATASLENEPEGGRRCGICFKLRLERTYLYLLDSGGDAFTTTLTISPRKSAALVNRIGQEIGQDSFLARDFKKREGFKRATELARKWDLYRQDYCGCQYSLRQRSHI